MHTKFQITTWDKHSSQFSRVAQQSIISGVDLSGVRARIAHLNVADTLNFTAALEAGIAQFRDREGNLNMVRAIN